MMALARLTSRGRRDNVNFASRQNIRGWRDGKAVILLASMVLLLSGAAANAEHRIVPEVALEPELLPVGSTREVCTYTEWGYDEVRTDCRYEVLPPPRGNPALQGVCTTRYGLRTCY
jgi:hypothetical protein